MSESLEKYREQIDFLDKQLIALFEERMEVSKAIARYKQANKIAIFNPEREQAVIAKGVSLLKNATYQEVTRRFIHALMDCSKSVQEELIAKSKQ